jgi:hypothetical protein
LAPAAATAANQPKAGTYEVGYLTPASFPIACLVKITPKDDGVSGEVVAAVASLRGLELKSATLDGDMLKLALKGPSGDIIFEGRVTKSGADTVLGTLEMSGRMLMGRIAVTDKTALTPQNSTVRSELPEPMQKLQALATKVNQLRQRAAQATDDEKSKLTNDAADAEKEYQAETPKAYREVLEKHANSLAVETAATYLIRQAEKDKADAAHVRGWAGAMLKVAQPHGQRYEGEVAARVAELLTHQAPYADLALEYARQAEKSLSAKEGFDRQVRVLTVLATAEKKANRSADADKTLTRVAKLELGHAVEAEKALTDRDTTEKRATVLGLLAAAQRKSGMTADAERTTARVVKLELEHAQQLEKALTDKDSPEKQASVLNLLAAAQRRAGLTADAAKSETNLAKIDADLDRDYMTKVPPFKPTAFAGRKAQSDRAVVMELFTGAQCPPCVAADVAFDVLEKTYKHGEVVLIQYHLHIPGPDPMTNAATEARAEYYGANSTPTVLFNGKNVSALDPNVRGGGNMAMAEERYGQYSQIINKLMEEPAGAAVKLSANRLGDVINVRADVATTADPGSGKRLRFVVVEEAVRFTGANKLRLHHMVVRAMPGGADGIALTKKDGSYSASVNLGDLRQELTDYLYTYAATKRPFPQPERPMAFNNLKAIALVQDDATKDILQAVIVDVSGERVAK